MIYRCETCMRTTLDPCSDGWYNKLVKDKLINQGWLCTRCLLEIDSAIQRVLESRCSSEGSSNRSI